MSKYAVLVKPTKLRVCLEEDAQAVDDEESERLLEGTLLKVMKPTAAESKYVTVQVLDLVEHNAIYEQNVFACPQSHMRKVNEDLWPYIISIAKPERRLQLLSNDSKCDWVMYLKPNDIVSVMGELFGDKHKTYDCIIRYIGPVHQLHPVGHFFGLELLNLDHGASPQSDNIPFAINYMQCDPQLSIFTTADWLIPLQGGVEHKKKSTFEFLSGTIGKVVGAIGPNGCGFSPNDDPHGLKTSSSKKKKEATATARFYDIIEPTSANMNVNTGTLIDVTDKMDTQDKKSATEPVTLTGILKHTHVEDKTQSDDLSANTTSNKHMGSTMFNLEHKNIIVIDQEEIDECTRQEQKVIVVDKGASKSVGSKKTHEDVDLAELLGGNWPNTAGDAATILNKNNTVSSKSNAVSSKRSNSHSAERKSERNKTAVLVDLDTHEPSAPAQENGGTPDSLLPTEIIGYAHGNESLRSGLGVGSMVEVNVPEISEDLYGVIRWVGIPPGGKHTVVGVELENVAHCARLRPSAGSYNGFTLFQCNEPRAIFVSPNCCTIDRRFIDVDGSNAAKAHIDVVSDGNKLFGQIECPSVPGAVAPLKIYNLEELNALCGKFKGIQGHHNSCYLDATLFAMFTFTCVFDSLLFRPPEPEDISNYLEVQTVLREEIVNPLRKNMFVRADRVMKLRQLLDKLSSVSGLTSEEKDPEEFLNSLLSQILRVEPFLKLSSGQDTYFYQLFVEKDERLSFPTVQQLFEQSFHSSDIKLKEVPSCLIIQMPRFGKNYKMYPRILPSQVLDVTDIIEDSPRQCSVCGKLAEYECRDCFGILQGEMDLESTAFCRKCLETVHQHAKRASHTWKKFAVPQDFKMMAEHTTVPRLYMELFAVVCIETSHYVAFVKAGSGPDAPWCFFDSMADRKGEQNGYNIPEMLSVPDLPEWLSEEGARLMNETSSNDKMLPEHAKRIFCDAYMCMYQSTDVMMYR